MLLAKGADIEGRDNLQRTALGGAANMGHKEVVQLLLEKGADMKAKDGQGCTPLHLAVRRGSLEIVTLLIQKGADVRSRSTNGHTMVGDAAAGDNAELVKRLREYEKTLYYGWAGHDLIIEAAGAIEKLERENAKLVRALAQLMFFDDDEDDDAARAAEPKTAT